MTLDHATVGKNGAFCGAEYTLILDRNGRDKQLNIVAVIEFDGDKAKRTRLYYRRARVDGVQHVRDRILAVPLDLEPYQPALAEHQAALTAGDANAQADTFSPVGRFDGHGEDTDLSKGLRMASTTGAKPSATCWSRCSASSTPRRAAGDDGQRAANIQKVNGFTDGRIYVLEFNIIDPNHPTNRVYAGVSCYEIGEDGLIKEALVYDKA